MSAQAPDVLARILRSTREELERRKHELPQGVLEDRARRASAGADERAERTFREALADPGIAVIAEFKRRSPSAGELRRGAQLEGVIEDYAGGGARALSVLTEQPHFGGSLDDLREARRICSLPLLRKDFIVEEYQLLEARLAGADAVLLIVAALDLRRLRSLLQAARELGLDALVEVHELPELELALAAGAELIGVNNRDLHDFSVDVGRTRALLEHIPEGVIVVSESGISSPAQLDQLEAEGVQAVLVGESLMRADEPQRALEELLGPRARLSQNL